MVIFFNFIFRDEKTSLKVSLQIVSGEEGLTDNIYSRVLKANSPFDVFLGKLKCYRFLDEIPFLTVKEVICTNLSLETSVAIQMIIM